MITLPLSHTFFPGKFISACSIKLSAVIKRFNDQQDESCWLTNRSGNLSFRIQLHQLPSGKWTAGILTRSGTFHGNHRFGSLNSPSEQFRTRSQARRFALKLANQMATLRYAYQ